MTIIADYKLEIVLLDVMNQKPYIDTIQLKDLIVCLYQQVVVG